MKAWLAALATLVLSACASMSEPMGQSIDETARDYVRLALEIDAHESGYVDAYYGPDEWREAARANPRGRPALKVEAERLLRVLDNFSAPDSESAQRAKVLRANIASARFRLDMIDGRRVSFVDEAEGLFVLRPEIKPLEAFDAALQKIDATVPGDGPLAARVEVFRSRYAIPEDRLQLVMDTAIAECRRRTLAFISLPEDESFDMELVKGKSWGAYNYYQGGNRSLIQINTDLPVSIGNALVLACHEGYPGHHVQGIFNERAYRSKGWSEYAVAPLYAPAAPLNEGGADFGVELAFPGDERLAFEKRVLYPLAGLDPATADAYDTLRTATAELDGALLAISRMHLDAVIGREEVITLAQKYRLAPRDIAEQSLAFDNQYRSYVINYSAGEALIRAYIDRAGSSQAARWAAYEHILSTPMLPADLK